MIDDIIDVFLRDDLARQQDRNARRVNIDEFRNDPPGGFLEGHDFRFPVERFARRQRQVRDFRDFDDELLHFALLVVVLGHAAQRGKQGVDRFPGVSRRHEAQNIVHIAELDFQIVMLAQPILGLVSGNAEVTDVNRQLGRIVIVRRLAAQYFVADAVQPGNLVDFLSGVPGKPECMLRELAAVKRQVAAGRVERTQQNIGGRCRGQHADDRLHAVRIDAARAHVQHRALRHGAAELVHAGGGHIGAGLHRGNRQLLMEMNEHAVRFVDKHRNIVFVYEIDDFLQVCADAEIGRIDDDDRFRVRVPVQGAAHRAGRNAVIDAEILVACGRNEDRPRAGENDGGHNRFVHVARHDDFVARRADGKDHRHDGAARSLHREVRIIGAEGVGRQLLGLLDDAGRLVQVVERSYIDQVDRQRIVSDEGAEFRVAAHSFFVSGNVELNGIVLRMLAKGAE